MKGIFSDLHMHGWSQFSSTNAATGLNSRLEIIIAELERGADEIIRSGGKDMILAGDLFHVRGSIDPEVFNPVHQAFKRIVAKGIKIWAIPGNHDLKGKETTEIGNAIQTLGEIDGFTVITKTGVISGLNMAFVPWVSTPGELRNEVSKLQKDLCGDVPNVDLVIHAGLNDVLMGMPDHGLDASEVASWGFRRVLAGHYHNHKVMEGGKVISIGASTHQTWSDVGTRAGFVLFDDTTINWRASQAPSFVQIDENTDDDEIPLFVDGNYVRIRGKKMTDAEINSFRKELMEMGAKGVRFDIAREVVSARSAGKPTKALSLDDSVAKYIDASEADHKEEVKDLCASLLLEVRSAAA